MHGGVDAVESVVGWLYRGGGRDELCVDVETSENRQSERTQTRTFL